MKKYISFSIICLSIAGIFAACEKNDGDKIQNEPLRGLAYLKVVDIAPNFRTVFNAPDTFNIFYDQQKLSGSFLTYNGSFPVAPSSAYAAVDPGVHKVRLTRNGPLNGLDPVSILEIPHTFVSDTKSTLLITDSSIKNSVYSIWLNDNFVLPAANKFSLRFVNAVLNDTVGKTVDVYSKRYATRIFTNVAPRAVVDFTSFDYTPQSDTLYVFRPGTTDTLSRLLAASFGNKRVYTLIYKGNTTLASTVAKGKNLLIVPNN